MVTCSQFPHSVAVSVMSNHRDLKRILNSQSASSSGPRSSNDSLSCVTCSNSYQRTPSRSPNGLYASGCRVSQSLNDVYHQKGRNVGGAAVSHIDCGRLNPYEGQSSIYRIELTTCSFNEHTTTRMNSFPVGCSASDITAAESSPELPLFPLPLVLFPGAILPLQIFEFRYRIMMHTLLQTDLRFGVVYTDKTSGLAGVGCVGEVVKHERLVDDRFFMICKGQERFRVIDIVRTKPYIVARVEWLEDRPSGEQADVEALADEVETFMKDVIRLSNRVNGKPEKVAPEDLRKKLFPTPFSFWVGSTFEGAPVEQQALLELEDTAQRLKREKETLRNTLNYLSAASAVKDAFPSAE